MRNLYIRIRGKDGKRRWITIGEITEYGIKNPECKIDMGAYKNAIAELYKYTWGNIRDKDGNLTRRGELKNRFCKIVETGKMRSVLVQFIDGERQKEVVDRYALRKIKRGMSK